MPGLAFLTTSWWSSLVIWLTALYVQLGSCVPPHLAGWLYAYPITSPSWRIDRSTCSMTQFFFVGPLDAYESYEVALNFSTMAAQGAQLNLLVLFAHHGLVERCWEYGWKSTKHSHNHLPKELCQGLPLATPSAMARAFGLVSGWSPNAKCLALRIDWGRMQVAGQQWRLDSLMVMVRWSMFFIADPKVSKSIDHFIWIFHWYCVDIPLIFHWHGIFHWSSMAWFVDGLMALRSQSWPMPSKSSLWRFAGAT